MQNRLRHGGLGGIPTLLKSSGGLLNYLLRRDIFQWLWVAGSFNGDNLLSLINSDVITVTGKDFTTSYIPEDTFATFAVPDNATYLAADGSDDFWFDALDALQQKSFTELIESTTLRTFVKYTDFEPYQISAIGILKEGVVLTNADKITLTRFFKLWTQYWGEEMMEQGYMKDNRDFIEA